MAHVGHLRTHRRPPAPRTRYSLLSMGRTCTGGDKHRGIHLDKLVPARSHQRRFSPPCRAGEFAGLKGADVLSSDGRLPEFLLERYARVNRASSRFRRAVYPGEVVDAASGSCLPGQSKTRRALLLRRTPMTSPMYHELEHPGRPLALAGRRRGYLHTCSTSDISKAHKSAASPGVLRSLRERRPLTPCRGAVRGGHIDDGCESDVLQAAPILLNAGFGATFYVVAGFIGPAPATSAPGEFPRTARSGLRDRIPLDDARLPHRPR